MATHPQAPSEKHLERWICANPHLFGDAESVRATPVPFCKQIIGQQVQLVSGVADLLGWGAGVRVIEIKKGIIDWDAAQQVIRYFGDVRSLWLHTLLRARDHNLITQEDMHEALMDDYVGGFLVGHSVGDPMIVDACGSLNIHCVEYFYAAHTNRYWFKLSTGTKTRARLDAMMDQQSRIVGTLQQHLTAYFKPRVR